MVNIFFHISTFTHHCYNYDDAQNGGQDDNDDNERHRHAVVQFDALHAKLVARAHFERFVNGCVGFALKHETELPTFNLYGEGTIQRCMCVMMMVMTMIPNFYTHKIEKPMDKCNCLVLN